MAIMVAAGRRRRLHLTADEVQELARDSAIETCATNMLSDDEHRVIFDSGEPWPTGWAKINPVRP